MYLSKRLAVHDIIGVDWLNSSYSKPPSGQTMRQRGTEAIESRAAISLSAGAPGKDFKIAQEYNIYHLF